MHGYQIRLLVEKMYYIHELIRKGNWEELKQNVEMGCTVEDILFELNDYPGELSECNINEFFEALRLGDFDGFNVDAMAQFWIDGEESDLSMECSFVFYGRNLKKLHLKEFMFFNEKENKNIYKYSY